DARRSTAHRARGDEAVRRADGARARADLRHVAVTGRPTTDLTRAAEVAARRAARARGAVRGPLVALLAGRGVDDAVAAQRRERHRHEVAVVRQRARRTARVLARAAAAGRAVLLADAHRRLARVRAHAAVPGE